MNRITATCIAGMRSKTTSRIRIHFFPRPREANPFTRVPPRGRSVLRGFGLGILAKRLRWRPERNQSYFELCDCSESVIVIRLTADPMTLLRVIPCPAVSPRRSFSAKIGALAKEGVQYAAHTSAACASLKTFADKPLNWE